MRIAILETIVMPAGHEVEFDRILVEELKRQGHEPIFFVPENFPFKLDYQVPVEYLEGGEVVSYAGCGKLKKIWLSVVREHRRIAWFNAAYEKIRAGECDGIIIPTATYRYLRTLRNSKLAQSPVPINFIFHGINPHEQPKFEEQAKKCSALTKIHLNVITLRNDFTKSGLTNLKLIVPPVFTAQDLVTPTDLVLHQPLRIGFFGQFRKEKNLEFFLEAFTEAKFSVPVELIVQGATAKPEDGELFEIIAKKYENKKNITFWHKNLIGLEWQKALLDVDVIMMPYGAERYRYHWSAMLFTAMGFYKPVLISPEINPEVLEKYPVGMQVSATDKELLRKQLETFVADLHLHLQKYQDGLAKANVEYGHKALVESILGIQK